MNKAFEGDRMIRLAEDGKCKKLRDLLVAKPELARLRSDYGWTPLHRAAQFGRLKTARLLVANGADVNALDDSGNSPLHDAAHYDSSLAVMRFLVASGANIEVANNSLQTPLMEAVQYSNLICFAFLVGLGARTDLINQTGHSLSQMARFQLEGLDEKKYEFQIRDLKIMIKVLTVSE